MSDQKKNDEIIQVRICPLTAAMVPRVVEQSSLSGQQRMEATNQMFPCYREQCEWWHEGMARCTVHCLAEGLLFIGQELRASRDPEYDEERDYSEPTEQ